MSIRNNNEEKNELFLSRIEPTDTISQFMEKCNNNFSAILKYGGGPAGDNGEPGPQGVPTKPKVPIHVWKKGEDKDYKQEISIGDEDFKINGINVNLTDVKYEEGHLIILENAHVYILTLEDFKLVPKYIMKFTNI